MTCIACHGFLIETAVAGGVGRAQPSCQKGDSVPFKFFFDAVRYSMVIHPLP